MHGKLENCHVSYNTEYAENTFLRNMKYAFCGLNVCSFQNSHVGILKPNVMMLGGEAFGI